MPRKRPLPERERGICRRLREFRERLQWTRPQFGSRAGIDEEMLARYERELVPVRYCDAWTINWSFGLNAEWLATGDGMMSSNARIPLAEALGIPEKAKFSDAWSSKLSSGWRTISGSLAPGELGESIDRSFARIHGYQRRVAMERVLASLIEDVSDCATDEQFAAVFREAVSRATEMLEAVSQSSKEYFDRCLFLDAERAKHQMAEINLDSLGLPLFNSGVLPSQTDSPHWAVLLERIRNVTQRSGSKVALAAALGVTKSAVSQWLAGRAQPSAEKTLRMLNWVAAEEAKNKKRGPGAFHRPRTNGPNDRNT